MKEWRISEGVYIHRCAKIHPSVKIAPATVIGAPPLMLEIVDGHRTRKTISGGIDLHRGVDIGSNCSVVQGVHSDTTLEEYVFVAHGSTIGHDCKIGKNTVVCAGVHLMGEVIVDPWCYIGPGTVIQPHTHILEGTMIGGFSQCVREHYDVPPWSIAWGNPCKFIRENKWRPTK